MSAEALQAEDQLVEVLDTSVACVEDDKQTTVITTLTLRNAVTKKEFQQSSTETRAKPRADVQPVLVAEQQQQKQHIEVDPKKLAEFYKVFLFFFCFENFSRFLCICRFLMS
jgi:hypothetical protein